MADLIDRQEAIRIASGYCHPANVVKELAKLPSVQPKPQWIPCSERLPDKKMDVIVTVNVGNWMIYTTTEEWTGTGFLTHGHNVIAWMPLPEPYREDKE